ncbi:MAG: CoB--CoM heterodisulfide reductase iron-sulfur subunit A family protein [Thermoanaerobaculaceae bacterium]|nr:CoB--CoM heterodisulfide reductase iron-sulfur subunit A family protein [Thermoanaerobaculaceae bacterium]MDI9622865.1 CoB--CoM heterodisulfide reductase iron-sulfur subunit A family protein [Acidobacteriota bacterium]NLH11699.1 CoB--CoM heterodisulfide reductase iron-sulfur subunit A family protein [Holophagae bacterium]HPW56759.1 CoB--CoM heterodisulfide reductase iron-sulfur subunit A family protein [Thermoanaerobaculaceae bacterium]
MEKPRIGVFVCNCGTNISHIVDTEAVRAHAQAQPDVVVATSYRYMCSTPGQETIVKAIQEHQLNRVVVAACSPRMHEKTFRGACRHGGINPFLFEMANIREQCSWVHQDRLAATEKAKSLTTAAIHRVRHHRPLNSLSAEMCPTTLVLGGGIAGLTAALELADSSNDVVLVERTDALGGNLARVDLTAPHLDSARDLLTEKLTRIASNPRVTVLLRSELVALSGFVGNFTATIRGPGGNGAGPERQVRVGNVVVATGYQEFDAGRITHYGHGKLPNVVTSFEFEQMLRAGRIETRDGRLPQYAAIIHCVGSRNREFHPYCSRVCCMTALKYAHELKSANPACYVSDIYIDMHAFGKGCEEFYKATSEVKTLFLMFEKNEHPVIRRAGPGEDCDMLIEVNERLSGERIEIPADLVILMVGVEARSDAAEVARLVNISQDREGWFMESHPKLDPVATTTDGIYIAGTCAAPKDIPDSVAQARAAAARILARISKGRIEIDGVFAEVDEDRCSGCRICNELCPYSAIEFDEGKRRSHVIPAACKACGACVAACPSGAITGHHFTAEQIHAQIDGVLA